MSEKVFLVHGWAATNTRTYGWLHRRLAESGFQLQEVYLGHYVSLDDHVEVADLSKAMQLALERPEHLGPGPWTEPFHVITHSTGALITRLWIKDWYTGAYSNAKALRNVVFLAPPHFGSRLAHHGRSMLAHVGMRGDTGTKILNALELSSAFNWDLNEAWLNDGEAVWRSKGVRPYCLIGDRVYKKLIDRAGALVFPAHWERGSDMTVRVAAGNMNFKRFTLDGDEQELKQVGELSGVPFAALEEFTHSDDKHGIMGSIGPFKTGRNLEYILKCLKVTGDAEYESVRADCEKITTGKSRKDKHYCQLNFRIRDKDFNPIDDYRIELGEARAGDHDRPAKFIAHTHKNQVTPSHFTFFIDMRDLDGRKNYYVHVTSSSGTGLLDFKPDEIRAQLPKGFITPDMTIQTDVIFRREPRPELFGFLRGDDDRMPLEWDRKGKLKKI